MQGLRDLSCEGSLIGVKRMGQVDEKPFMKVCKQKFIDENVEVEYAMLCSKWQNALNDSAWHPFKRVGTGENMKVSLCLMLFSVPVLSILFYMW